MILFIKIKLINLSDNQTWCRVNLIPWRPLFAATFLVGKPVWIESMWNGQRQDTVSLVSIHKVPDLSHHQRVGAWIGFLEVGTLIQFKNIINLL